MEEWKRGLVGCRVALQRSSSVMQDDSIVCEDVTRVRAVGGVERVGNRDRQTASNLLAALAQEIGPSLNLLGSTALQSPTLSAPVLDLHLLRHGKQLPSHTLIASVRRPQFSTVVSNFIVQTTKYAHRPQMKCQMQHISYFRSDWLLTESFGARRCGMLNTDLVRPTPSHALPYHAIPCPCNVPFAHILAKYISRK